MLTCNNFYQNITFKITRTTDYRLQTTDYLKTNSKFVEQGCECYLASVSGAGTDYISTALEFTLGV